ncbi:MAG: pyridoxamine 5'-phosphate oxidase family protein, partial [Planctomycetota bacterium]
MNEKELKQECLKLMEAAEAAYLSTIDGDGFPQTRVMGNLRNAEQYSGLTGVFSEHNEDFLIYLTTSASSAKMEQIKVNPKVS